MMIPTLLLVTIGSRNRVPIPVLLFLLWPFVLLAALIAGATRIVIPAERWQRSVFAYFWLGVCLFCSMHGLTVDVKTKNDTTVFIKIV